MCSTPNRPDGLFESIEKDPKSKYHKIFLLVHVGLAKIFDRKEIDKKRDIVFNHRFTFSGAVTRLRQLYGGICSSCGAWPLYKAMHDMGDERQGAWLVYRYCQECFDKQPIADTYNKKENKKK